MFTDISTEGVNETMNKAWQAFRSYGKSSLKTRGELMRKIAMGLQSAADNLVPVAMKESHLPEARLRNELTRTVFQLTSYADAAEKGQWLEVRIDTAEPAKIPPKPDLRKMLIPIGPVVVFGSSNFPFAYSTAGGDTASALAAGCTVVVKAHPAHPETSAMVASIVNEAVKASHLPEHVFQHVYGASFEVGKALVTHELTKAVGFTGSFTGGKALFDWGAQRKEPIPVFAEMGSTNPVFLFPERLDNEAEVLAKQLAASMTLGVGQFCTKPGLIIGIDSDALREFVKQLAFEVEKTLPGLMLHQGISDAFEKKKALALARPGINFVAQSNESVEGLMGRPTIAMVDGVTFLHDPILHQEVFGPWSLVISCSGKVEMKEVAEKLEGQLTISVMATEKDILNHQEIVSLAQQKCGRFIFNGVPTGVEVCLSMHHGGPYPSTSDPRFTSVGADAIKRFARPISFQNWPDSLLPEELKNSNPLGIWRTVNSELVKSEI